MPNKLAIVGPTVLLVDDEPDERLLIRRELESAGMDVHECRSGKDALNTLKELIPSVILLDVNMPGIGGIEVCREIRLNSSLKDIPILMLTGFDGLDYIRRAFDAGATDFITKSRDLGLVSQRVKYALRNSSNTKDLKSWQSQMKRAHRAAKIGYWQLTVANCHVTLSDEALKLFSMEQSDFGGTFSSFLDSVHVSDRENVKSAVDAALFNDNKLNIDFRSLMKDGVEFYANLQGEVITNDKGEPVSMMGVVQDITERKKSEATIQHQALYDSLTDL